MAKNTKTSHIETHCHIDLIMKHYELKLRSGSHKFTHTRNAGPNETKRNTGPGSQRKASNNPVPSAGQALLHLQGM